MTGSSEASSHCLFLPFTEELPPIIHLHFPGFPVHDLYPYALMTVVAVFGLLHERSVFTTGGKWVRPCDEDWFALRWRGENLNRAGLRYHTAECSTIDLYPPINLIYNYPSLEMSPNSYGRLVLSALVTQGYRYSWRGSFPSHGVL